jgi:tetratricopeptide (TPR) repeat protein
MEPAQILVLISLLLFLALFGVWLRLPTILTNLTESALRKGNYAAALRYTDWMGSLRLRPVVAVSLRGAALLGAGQLQEAEQFVRESLRMKLQMRPEQAQKIRFTSLTNLARIYREQGRTDDALHTYQEAQAINEQHSLPYLGQAMVYLEQSREPQRALELLGTALEHEPNHPDANLRGLIMVGRAWALTLLGNDEDASEAFSHSILSTNPDDKPRLAEVHERAGRVLLLRNEHESAREYFANAITHDPQGRIGEQARRALEEIAPAAEAEATEDTAEKETYKET